MQKFLKGTHTNPIQTYSTFTLKTNLFKKPVTLENKRIVYNYYDLRYMHRVREVGKIGEADKNQTTHVENNSHDCIFRLL